jgi:3-oxoacyl-[acyl-carrier protein] reductase
MQLGRKKMKRCDLRPKNILVLGGGSGIRKAIVEELLISGAENIIIASRNKAKLDESAKGFKTKWGQRVYTLSVDITNVKANRSAIKQAEEMLGGKRLDGLVLSSGVNFDASNWKGFNITEEDWDKVMNTNLFLITCLIILP